MRRPLDPFPDREAQQLATLFAVVYFAQGMWALPVQVVTVHFKELGLSAGEVADFFLLGTVPWVLKPIYGVISDTVPLFGRRRKSYFVLMTTLAAAAAFGVAGWQPGTFATLAPLYVLMGFGLAFTDVIVDAVMVENGKPRGLTGAFQSVQWASISVATLAVGALGGYLAERRALGLAFFITGLFPLISLTTGGVFIREARVASERQAFGEAWASIVGAARTRDLWVVAAFIFFFTFSPSFGPAFLYYQTDILGFSQQFIGWLDALTAATSVAGAFIYAPLSRRYALKPLILGSIGVSVAGTLAFLLYRGPYSAAAIAAFFGVAGMVVRLSFLNLAARACPKHAEGTFFALLMAVSNGAMQLSTNVGSRLYDIVGYQPLVVISTVTTALTFALVPFVPFERLDRQPA